MPNMLNAAQTAEFNEKGFTYARGLFAPDEVKLLTRAMEEDPAVRGSILDRRDGEGRSTGERHAARLRLAGACRRAARVGDAKVAGDAGRDSGHGGAVPRPALPVGRPVAVGVRLLRADVGGVSRARHHDPARCGRPVRRRQAGVSSPDAPG